MTLRENACFRSDISTAPIQLALLLLGMTLAILLGQGVEAQTVSTTTVQGTVYLANGQPGSGSVLVSWPAFVTAQNQAITAGTTTVMIATDGFLSANLAPNQGATPAGLYYTAVYHLSDGTTSTEYWVVPAAAQASLSSVRAQVMPAAQAVQTVSKAYVDQEIAELTGSLLTASGGTLSGPLYLNGDPTLPLQAADKHYVDATNAEALPLTGGALTGPLTGVQLGAVYQVDQFAGADFGAKLAACLGNLNASYGGTCDARNFSGTQTMGANLIISTADVAVQLPCAPISTTNQILVTAGTRNVALRGCAFRGTNGASGAQGGTVLLYAGTASAIQVGDPTYAVDTQGFHLDNVAINTTGSTSANAQALTAFRTQEMDVENVYLLGNPIQTGMTLDGTGNYTGGTFLDVDLSGFQQAVNAVGHQIANPATTDWMNASTFVRLHIDCPTANGNPIAGTYGINLAQGDGNTFAGGDVEGCDVALHLGANAQNNTIVGLRNENSNNQIMADTGSAYNNWMTGGTMFTGKLTDNGTRNSFLDTFHRSFNGIKGDWYGSQQDATVTNHYRLGIGLGNERGLLDRYQSDYGYRWTTGLSDATAGEQFYQILDELNNVYRVSIGQYNDGQSSTNNQTVINAAGTGAVVLNGSNGSGTGGVVFGSGGSAENTVATIDSQGDAQFNGTLQVSGTSTFDGSTTVKNQADAEIDAFLWAGATKSQKESFIYKDWNGNSQWYMVKDASNNWALNSATGGLDSFKAYQNTNSGDTYVNASNSTGHIRLNYETGSGAETDIYAGSSASLTAAFLGTNAIKFPGLAAASGHGCLQIDTSGYLSNSGAACSAGSGTVNAGSTGQIAYYAGNGTAIAGTNTVPVTAGGTGASSASAALASLGAQAAMPGVSTDGANGLVVAGAIAATSATAQIVNGIRYASNYAGSDIGARIASAISDWKTNGGSCQIAVTVPGTISTWPDIPQGCSLTFTPGTYTATTTLLMHHTGSSFDFGGAVLIDSIGGGTPAIDIGKASALAASPGTVNTSGTTVTWVSGPTFADIDPGDQIAINGTAYNVSSVSSSTSLTVTASAGTQTGPPFMAIMYVESSLQTKLAPQVKNVTIVGGSGDHVRLTATQDVILDKVTSINAGALPFEFRGANSGDNYSLIAHGGTTGAIALNGFSFAGLSSGSNDNRFFGGEIVGTAAGSADAVSIASGEVTFYGTRWAGNYAANSAHIQGGAGGFNCYGCSMERNGNGTSSSVQVLFDGSTTAIPSAGILSGMEFSDAGSSWGGLGVAVKAVKATGLKIENSVFAGYASAVSSDSNSQWTDDTNTYSGSFSGGAIAGTGPGVSIYSAVGLPTMALTEIGGLNTNPLNFFSSSAVGGEGDPAAVFNHAGSTAKACLLFGTATNAKNSSICGVTNSSTAGDLVLRANIAGNQTEIARASSTTGLFNSTSGYSIGGNSILNSSVTGPHGTSGTKVQLSDGTGGSGNLSVFASDGSLTNGGAHNVTLPVSCVAASGSGTAYTCSTSPAFTPAANDRIQFKADVANTGAATLNVNGSGAAPLYKWGNTSTLANGDLQAGHYIGAYYDGAHWQLEGQLGSTASSSQVVYNNTPAWLQFLGSGADGANTTASGMLTGEKFYTNFTVPYGNTVTVNQVGLVVHATGTCTIAGTIDARGVDTTVTSADMGGGAGGGSGGGAAAGTAGAASLQTIAGGFSVTAGGTAGASSGGNGGNGGTYSTTTGAQRAVANSGGGSDGLGLGGGAGQAGGSSGGARGLGGLGVVLICSSITGTDGTHTGVIDVSGGYGMPPAANSVGAGSGGGGGVALLSSQTAVATWPTVYAAGGPGGLVAVPEALATSGSCTSQPKVTLGVSGGALSGACTVIQAGAGCGTGTNMTWNIAGGGGTAGTAAIVPTWSGGALASCTATAGTSSGYTAATYTTAGTGGDGYPGWFAEYQGW